jgi:hypothetical protein
MELTSAAAPHEGGGLKDAALMLGAISLEQMQCRVITRKIAETQDPDLVQALVHDASEKLWNIVSLANLVGNALSQSLSLPHWIRYESSRRGLYDGRGREVEVFEANEKFVGICPKGGMSSRHCVVPVRRTNLGFVARDYNGEDSHEHHYYFG